jgi:hypothetical protein
MNKKKKNKKKKREKIKNKISVHRRNNERERPIWIERKERIKKAS